MHSSVSTLISAALLSTGGLLCCPVQPVAAQAQHAHTSAVPSLPAIPHLTPLSTAPTSLANATIQSDVLQLHTLLSAHRGDGITRGPDQLIYNVDASINPALHEFGGDLAMHMHNNLGQALSTLYFNVWPDSYHYRKEGGYEQVSHVTVDGQKAAFTLRGTLMTIHLPHPIAKNNSAVIRLQFLALLPKNLDRFGWNGTAMNFGNWFPILAVHDQYGWVTPPYYPDGESFYSLSGDFQLHVSAPKSLILAISGEQASAVAHANGTVTYNYNANGVRDVAMVGDSQYKILQGKVGRTTVYTYYTPAQANQSQLMEATGLHSVAVYDKDYGPYPYKTLRLCAMRGWFGGMEYPQLDMISFQGHYDPAFTKLVVAHEIAHQWFFAMVGDDEFLTPWIDEAFATFSEMRVDKDTADLLFVPTVPAHVSDPVASFPSSDFGVNNGRLYSGAVYYDGARVLYYLQRKLGDRRFNTFMRAYFQQYQYQVATTQDFVAAASKAAKTNLIPFFEKHGVFMNNDTVFPVSKWAPIEERQDGRNWH